jgi:hypothetical protein
MVLSIWSFSQGRPGKMGTDSIQVNGSTTPLRIALRIGSGSKLSTPKFHGLGSFFLYIHILTPQKKAHYYIFVLYNIIIYIYIIL